MKGFSKELDTCCFLGKKGGMKRILKDMQVKGRNNEATYYQYSY